MDDPLEELHRLEQKQHFLRDQLLKKAITSFAHRYLFSPEDGPLRPISVEWNEALFPARPANPPEDEFVRALSRFTSVALTDDAMGDAFRTVIDVCRRLFPDAEIEALPRWRALRLIDLLAQNSPLERVTGTAASSTVMVRLFRRDGGLLISMTPDMPLSMLETTEDESGLELF